MAIPTQNTTWLGAAPVAGGSTILGVGGTSMQELAYIGTATFVLDGSLTTTTCNFLDGTNALSFSPSAILCNRTGGNAASTIAASAQTINNIAFTVNFTAAGSSTNTVQVVYFAMK